MIVNRQRGLRIARKPLETFLRRVKNETGVEGFGITVCLVSDSEIAGMNERFRKRTGPTDVLSFPAEEQRRAAAGRKKRIHTESAKRADKVGAGGKSRTT